MALPCGAPQFLGRTFPKPNPIQVTENMSLIELSTLLKGRTENQTYILADDCESSAWLQKLLKSVAVNSDLSAQGLKNACENWPLFSNWTSQCWELISGFLRKGVELIHNNQLCLVSSVGLATNAAVSDQPKTEQNVPSSTKEQIVEDPGSYNGHCFNIARLKQENGKPYCFIVEGTASMVPIKVSSDSPKVTCKLWQITSSTMQPTVLDMGQFMTTLSKTFVSLTQIITSPNGGQMGTSGWPLGTLTFTLFCYYLIIVHFFII